MLPLNFALLKLFTDLEEADVNIVMDKLRDKYGHFRAFKRPALIEALMTAETNGLLEETHFDPDEKGTLRVFYRATDEGRAMIKKYIG